MSRKKYKIMYKVFFLTLDLVMKRLALRQIDPPGLDFPLGTQNAHEIRTENRIPAQDPLCRWNRRTDDDFLRLSPAGILTKWAGWKKNSFGSNRSRKRVHFAMGRIQITVRGGPDPAKGAEP